MRDLKGAAVLGGSGWLGRHVCSSLVRKGRPVLAVARAPAAHLTGCAFHPMDAAAATPEELADLLRSHRIRLVVNAVDAANARDGWRHDDETLHASNVRLAESLVAAAAALPWPVRLIHVGTVLEYGPLPPGSDIGDATVPAPRDAYARTRLAGSRAVLDAAGSGAVDGIVVRLANLCGPHPSSASFPGWLLESLRRARATGSDLTVRVADAQRDYVDVRDAAEALLRAADVGGTGTAFNIGRGEAVPIPELVRMSAEAAGLSGRLRMRRDRVTALGGDWTRVDPGPAAYALGWRPRISLADSLRDAWRAAGPPRTARG